ncbi:hypothetical protein HDU79_000327 [Rhizoclosmatium sp. JEL0117]|nr:hypothetical protein HDU79_000327 [Rhizoclosmatium sp. JEL0117]
MSVNWNNYVANALFTFQKRMWTRKATRLCQQRANVTSYQEYDDSFDKKDVKRAKRQRKRRHTEKEHKLEKHKQEHKPQFQLEQISATTIEMMPREVLDEIVGYLRDYWSMIRFCCAVPALNKYASILYAMEALHPGKDVSDFWPNFRSDCIEPKDFNDKGVPKAYIRLLDQFNGYTKLSEIDPSDIEKKVQYSSKNISLTLHSFMSMAEWGKFTTTHRKKIVELTMMAYLSPIPAQNLFRELNPSKIVLNNVLWKHAIVDLLQYCLHLRSLEVRYIRLPTCLPENQITTIKIPTSLRELLLVNASKGILSDVIQKMPQTNLQLLQLKFMSHKKCILNNLDIELDEIVRAGLRWHRITDGIAVTR